MLEGADGIDLAASLFVLLIIRLYRSALSGEPFGQARDARAGCQQHSKSPNFGFFISGPRAVHALGGDPRSRRLLSATHVEPLPPRDAGHTLRVNSPWGVRCI